ncbi:hypothetical protein H7H78_08730 [Mycobacterium shinjukuense]|uniref:Uncharacterized protein n=1 Tax=Mycobacterium shinjukuense TaxID=398694 RepID=A0A7I7MLM4_9MYCO|nr:hypothetical protein [Mycobacterium shinjukuense]MCV6985513.1 hypothetical protein [Mycobacterium shinjukuense]ORB66568.1 hypothetical protein BST45_13500 [Mycobacterium shinjukuense]BBX72712.1 hypothetical protein MSHI_06180 [Mycobacterium shinjukuense]
MSLRKFALGLSAGLIGITALVGGTGVAHADPENDATPEIIEDLIAVIPPLTQDARVLTPGDENNLGLRDWTGSGMYCQNRNANCKKMGF